MLGREAVVDQLRLEVDQSFGLLFLHAGIGKAFDKGVGIEGKTVHRDRSWVMDETNGHTIAEMGADYCISIIFVHFGR